ncbi:MAG TPA: type II toxin-antitoxin system VapC family toxin [Phycisphaerales bacterium]|nr:type II toxin-antitoxin system VapC family toxin [Phycisphaerales bacterium]HMP37778.1 type II toxin-antitoxin system VapC family toxin [Phycisphaerales bacterium]
MTDASVLLAVAFADEDAALAAAVLDAIQDQGALVPAQFWFEVWNVLVMSERRGRITPLQTHALLAELSAQPIEVDPVPPDAAVLNLAREHRLTVYDAAYLELARRQNATLATLDDALLASARAIGVPIFEARA